MHRSGCVNARANNLGIFYPIIPSERIKTRAMLDIRHAQFGDQNHPARRSARCFPLVWTSAKISQYFNRDGNLDLSCVWMRLMFSLRWLVKSDTFMTLIIILLLCLKCVVLTRVHCAHKYCMWRSSLALSINMNEN